MKICYSKINKETLNIEQQRTLFTFLNLSSDEDIIIIIPDYSSNSVFSCCRRRRL